jgi:hypothetical protein
MVQIGQYLPVTQYYMTPESKEAVETLKRLVFQVNGAIALIESGCVRPVEPYDAHRVSPDTIEVGDFIIKNRFTEPKF